MTEPPPRGSDSIGPTAHYTGYVWARNGMSTPELTTGLGRVLFTSAWPANALSGALGGPTLEQFLLARHRLIDHLLTEAIAFGRISQVLEVACGMSPRGWRFARDHGDAITYVEADLPAMAERKREALERAGSISEHHRVVEIDALAEDGPLSLGAVASELDSGEGLAVITEGLISYLDRDGVLGLWRRTAAALSELRRRLLPLRSPPRGGERDPGGRGVQTGARRLRAGPGGASFQRRGRGRGSPRRLRPHRGHAAPAARLRRGDRGLGHGGRARPRGRGQPAIDSGR